MSESKFRVRDVERDLDPVNGPIVIEAWDGERAAEVFVEQLCYEREYYDIKGDIRIGVRPNNRACDTCAGYGFYDDDERDTNPCPLCPELVYEVTVEYEPSCRASVERFNHPRPPNRCYACDQRMDNGADHSMIREPGRQYGDPFRYRCTTPSPEVTDVDDVSSRSDGHA